MDIFNLGKKKAMEFFKEKGITSIFKKGNLKEIPVMEDDFVKSYNLVWQRKPFQILEFGSGFSTAIMAYALKQNWNEYNENTVSKQIKKRYSQPQMVSIESSEKWLNNTKGKIAKTSLTDFSGIVVSKVRINLYQGQLCHFYEKLPDVVPDFVYLDGSDPKTVEGDITGLSFQKPKRTVISGDMIKYESTSLPGFFMIIDGRKK